MAPPHLVYYLEVYRVAVLNLSLRGHDHDCRLSGWVTHMDACMLQVRPTASNLRIQPALPALLQLLTESIILDTALHPLRDWTQRKGLYVSEVKMPPYTSFLALAKSRFIFLVVKEARSQQASEYIR